MNTEIGNVFLQITRNLAYIIKFSVRKHVFIVCSSPVRGQLLLDDTFWEMEDTRGESEH